MNDAILIALATSVWRSDMRMKHGWSKDQIDHLIKMKVLEIFKEPKDFPAIEHALKVYAENTYQVDEFNNYGVEI